MKRLQLLLGVLVAGCAAQPAPTSLPVTRQVKVDASNVVEVQKAGYKLVNKDGEPLYCRTDFVTGSHVQTRTQCLTPAELDQQTDTTKSIMSGFAPKAPVVPGIGH
jgi:hypothetical protein